MNFENISIGIGKTMVEFFSVEIVESVCRYLWKIGVIYVGQRDLNMSSSNFFK